MKTIEKELKNFNFPKILIDLHKNRKTGTLTVDTGEVVKKVFLDKGKAVFASSSDEDDRLGETLIKLGKITIDQYEKSVELLKETGKRQGTILVELGYLSPKDLVLGVKSQVREIIYSLFDVEYAEYEFDEGQLPKREVITLQMSMGDLIYEGMRKMDNVVRVKRDMPDMNAVLQLNEENENILQDIALSHKDQAMLSLIDGKKTVKELVDSFPNGTFEAMKILYVLYVTGIVEVRDSGASDVQIDREDELTGSSKTEEEDFENHVNELFSTIYTLSPHALLGINEKSDAKTVQSNYFRLVKEFHPDRYLSSTDPFMLDKLIAISEAIQNAYVLLKEDGKREEYFLSIQDRPDYVINGEEADTHLRSELSKASEEIFLDQNLSENQTAEENGDGERKCDETSHESAGYEYFSEMEHIEGTEPEVNEDVFITGENTDEAPDDQSDDNERIYNIGNDGLDLDDAAQEENAESPVLEEKQTYTDEVASERTEDSLSMTMETERGAISTDSTDVIELPITQAEDILKREESAVESWNEGDANDRSDSSIKITLREPDTFVEKRRYEEYESIFTGPDNLSDDEMFKSDVSDEMQTNESVADLAVKPEEIEDEAKGAQSSTSHDDINQQLIAVIEEIKVLLNQIRTELPAAVAQHISAQLKQVEQQETKVTPTTVIDNCASVKEAEHEQVNVSPEKVFETMTEVVKEYLEEPEQVMVREEDKIEMKKAQTPKKRVKLWHVVIAVLFLLAAAASFLLISIPQHQKAVPKHVQAKKEKLPTMTSTQTKEVNPPVAQKVNESRAVSVLEVKKPSAAAALQGEQHTVELIASDSTWLSVTIDEKSAREMMLKDGDRVKLTAKKNISLVIGNAAGLKVVFDGKEMGSLGGKGKVVRLKLPSSGNS